MKIGLGIGVCRAAYGAGSPAVDEGLRQFVLYGQSLSIGSDPDGGTVLSSTSATHYMLDAGVRAHIDQLALSANVNSPIDPAGCLALAPLGEAVSTNDPVFGETMASGIGAQLATRHVFTSTGRGAYTIESLSRDGGNIYVDQNHFANTHAAMIYASDLAAGNGWTYSIPAFGWKHGEANAVNGTTRATYRAALVTMRDDLRQAAEAAAHIDASAIPMLTDQLAYRHDLYNTGTGDSATGYGSIAVAAIQAHRAGDIVCVGPTYDAEFTAVNDVHFASRGYRNHGERWGRALATIEGGGTYHPCHITAASRSGTTITLTVHVPVAPLVKDTATFAARALANDGFTYTGANITAVTITDDGTGDNTATIEITLDAAAGGVLRYAYENAGTDIRNLVGGHIRDSASDVTAYDGTAQPNWLCTDEWTVA